MHSTTHQRRHLEQFLPWSSGQQVSSADSCIAHSEPAPRYSPEAASSAEPCPLGPFPQRIPESWERSQHRFLALPQALGWVVPERHSGLSHHPVAPHGRSALRDLAPAPRALAYPASRHRVSPIYPPPQVSLPAVSPIPVAPPTTPSPLPSAAPPIAPSRGSNVCTCQGSFIRHASQFSGHPALRTKCPTRGSARAATGCTLVICGNRATKRTGGALGRPRLAP